MRTILLALAISSSLVAGAQKDYANTYKVYNNDKTIRLDYISHENDQTVLYLTYMGIGTPGSFSGLYLNNFQLVAHSTGEIFRPISSSMPTQGDQPFFLHNSGTGIQLKIIFNRIPVYVKSFDLVEPTTANPPTYNFTFRNLKFDDTKNTYDEVSSWGFTSRTPLYLLFFTYQYFEYLEFTIDGHYVGRLYSTVEKGVIPECSPVKALKIAFADDKVRKIHIKGRSSGYEHTWNLEYRPLMYCMKVEIYKK